VIVDKIAGGGRKMWTWQIDSGHTSVGKGMETDPENGKETFDGAIEDWNNGDVMKEYFDPIDGDDKAFVKGNTFTLIKEDANLRATFISPKPAVLDFGIRTRYTRGAKSNVLKDYSKAVFATGGDEFFVVITIQRGDPPLVGTADGDDDTTITVGARNIRFEANRIVFEN
jgi:hypothetical protein